MADFLKAIEITLRHEGGYSNNKSDHGGETNWGISHKSYPDLDIKNLTLDEAKEIYRMDYWNKIRGDSIADQEIANKLFDIAVNCGVSIASKKIQLAINSISVKQIVVDGKIGPLTIAAINRCFPEELLNKFRELMLAYYESLNQPQFMRGWKIRLYSE